MSSIFLWAVAIALLGSAMLGISIMNRLIKFGMESVVKAAGIRWVPSFIFL